MVRRKTFLLARQRCWSGLIAVFLCAAGVWSGVAAQETAPGSAEQVELDKGLLAGVENRTGMRESENDVYYAILAHARDTSYAAQQQVAALNLRRREQEFRADPKNARRKFATFVDVFLNPESYQGELVPIEGYVRKIDEFSVEGENSQGLATLYQAWIYTDESQSHPAVVICTELPGGIREKLREDGLINNVRFSGYFFKLYAYRAQDANLRVAPMFLAQRLEWSPPIKSDPRALSIPLAVIVIGGVLIVIFAVWWVGRRDRQIQAQRRAREGLLDADGLIRGEEPPENLADNLPENLK